MYSAVSERGVEIATLRALGFSGFSLIVSVLIEAQLLALLGAGIGVALAQLFFAGQTVSTVDSTVGHNPQIVFSLTISSGLVVASVALACLIGLIGGVFPALRAHGCPWPPRCAAPERSIAPATCRARQNVRGGVGDQGW